MARELVCFAHPDRPAAARCRQCQKPVCGECAKTDANGKFCSFECARKFADFKSGEAPRAAAKTGLLTQALIVGILAALAIFIGGRYLNIPFCIKLLKMVNLH